MSNQERKVFHRYIRGIILIGLSMLLFKLLVTGNIDHFIAPKMTKFTYVAFAVFLLLGCLQVWGNGEEKEKDCHCCEHHVLPKSRMKIVLLYALFVIPIVSAFLFSNVTINGSLAANRGMNQSAQEKSVEQKVPQTKQISSDWKELLVDQEEEPIQNLPTSEQSPEQLEKTIMNQKEIQIDDKNYIQTMNIIGKDVLGFKGKQITFTGFIYNDKEVKGDKTVVARYGITCCIADASVWGMIVSGEEIKQFPEETWVKITGLLDETTYKGTLFPLVKVSKVEKIEKPKAPYVYDALRQ
ncbi:TIGR03943 family putative permease subunit [Bacillus pseudomycoides]|uniref:TIGR03943 family protein n=1 Tax=Bacillus pseudomycoides TaxID=64104 RepID=A0A2B5RX48_9BACI|nr:TIGR03943 family protein [Bacillus pseudomycoides]PDY47855.1 TIGR03943 family protein [Bacillus pseudomycoides]PEA80446.1 TIGR03943 family protein [Bacillus pseudomycoides]PED71977.1 TIGR03943 family protein [Bacillus pseudomycoides]PEI32871.1 TIGR03943 family protein [Bacillus pseudomycoides]PEJ80692.1 TIGR03943 family protein [Bacillus pseudomycoides]